MKDNSAVKNAKSSEVPHRNKDEVLQTERNDKYLPSANHICLKEEKRNRSFTVVAHTLFCHQAKDYLYCIVYKFRLSQENLLVTRILLATLLERGPDRNIQSLDLTMNNRSMIDLALNICTLPKVPSRESPSFHSKMKEKMALIPLLRFPRSDFSLSHSFPSRP